MKQYAARLQALARLGILQALAADTGYSLNHEMLICALEHVYAISLTDEEILQHLHWMEAQGLLSIETIGRYRVALLSHDGLRTAQGRKRLEGVARPAPGEQE